VLLCVIGFDLKLVVSAIFPAIGADNYTDPDKRSQHVAGRNSQVLRQFEQAGSARYNLVVTYFGQRFGKFYT